VVSGSEALGAPMDVIAGTAGACHALIACSSTGAGAADCRPRLMITQFLFIMDLHTGADASCGGSCAAKDPGSQRVFHHKRS
jgi:hypothetical protein